MGLLSDFFVARREDIDDAVLEEGVVGRFPAVEAKGVTDVNVATLGEILGAGTYDELLAAVEDLQADHGESGVASVPTAVRDALADTDDLQAVAARWANTEEFRRDELTAEDVLPFLEPLRDLARRARAEGRGLWLWWSL